MTHLPRWALSTGILLVLALFFRFALRGYAYTAYTLCFAAALVLLHHFLKPQLWRAVVVLLCLGFAYFTFVEIPIIRTAVKNEAPERDYLVVLGAAVHGDSPSLSLVHRLRGAQDYLEQYPDAVAIVSGGQGPGENRTEAECMYDWLVSHGIDEDRILMEDKATSTSENLQFSYEIIRQRGDEPEGNVAILSSRYHLFRAGQMSRLQGVEAVTVPGHWDYPLLTINYFIREAFGVTHLWVFGW